MKLVRKLAVAATSAAVLATLPSFAAADTSFASLSQLSMDELRARSYGGDVSVAATIECPGRTEGAQGTILSHQSDGMNLYARLQLPDSEAPEGGYPVVMFLHGWVGADGAPGYLFSCNEGGYYANIINAYADAGYAVVMPGFRGHGTFNDTPAEGIEWVKAWDNGTYLSPVLYAIDALNLLASLDQVGDLDTGNVNVIGHSQGGDAAAIVMAATGEGAANGLSVSSGSLWAGTYVDRFTQVETYHAMESTTRAFLAGDGSWTGTATGADGSVNPNFVFGFPPSWIGTMNQAEWGWQADYFNRNSSVQAAIEAKLAQMYDNVNAGVDDMTDQGWSITTNYDGSVSVNHSKSMAQAYYAIGAFHYPQYMTEPLAMHFSDRDFYSFPAWNYDMCERANEAGGDCNAYEYAGTTHTLGIGPEWYSPAGTVDGFPIMIERDLAMFGSE